MSRKGRGAIVSTRDPTPQVRDPVVEERRQLVSVYVDIPKCPECGGTVWRNGGTSNPNPLTREMVRYRTCRDCGKSFWIRQPMNARQIEKYCLPSDAEQRQA